MGVHSKQILCGEEGKKLENLAYICFGLTELMKKVAFCMDGSKCRSRSW